jgi:hypothetical protein
MRWNVSAAPRVVSSSITTRVSAVAAVPAIMYSKRVKGFGISQSKAATKPAKTAINIPARAAGCLSSSVTILF